MKIAKKILLSLAILIAVLLLVALFTQKDYVVEREISINKPKKEVFDYIKYLKNQNEYSVWAKMDPAMKKEFKGTDATVGFVSAWESDSADVGQGEQEIKKIIDGERIETEIRFIKPFESIAPSYMTTDSIDVGQTKVKWAFEGHTPYPMNLMLLFFDMETMIGGDLEKGLANLKVILEK
ncbi:SRPBCC family protein [Arcicella lustrica]|uniref:SRPBCC family protein n=1 Tax=Arcicella lustrica TaxID=2984196 RepID=A0ABU5SPQ2_9BACT|nr:SRPBCC family protein [Arcicella sp. DC25W]MEA5428919.1 SRPBCC family protein [Arcicella sp. DC25W]